MLKHVSANFMKVVEFVKYGFKNIVTPVYLYLYIFSSDCMKYFFYH